MEMGPVTLAAVDQEEIGMEETAPWGSWTPGRVAPPTPAAGCSSGMGSATHSVTLKSVCLMAMTVRLHQPAREPGIPTWGGVGGQGEGRRKGMMPMSYNVTTVSSSKEFPP